MTSQTEDQSKWREMYIRDINYGDEVAIKVPHIHVTRQELNDSNPVDDLEFLIRLFLKDPAIYMTTDFVEPIKEIRRKAQEVHLVRDEIYKAVKAVGYRFPFTKR
jgi:hypothetical protein